MAEFPTVYFTGDSSGLFSHVEIQRLMRSECDRATRYQYPVTAMMIAIDRLDQLGDLYGFESRDAILTEVSAVLRRNTRESDFLGCMIGNHFLAIFPHTKRESGPALARRLLADTSKLTFDAGQTSVHVTLSIGLAYRKTEESVDFEAICQEVRSAMEKSMASGGNRSEVWAPPVAAPIALPELGGSVEEIGKQLEQLLTQKVEAIFTSIGQSLPDFGGNQREVLALAVRKMEAEHQNLREEHSKQVELLERRLAKLMQSLESTEGELAKAAAQRKIDPGVASVYRTVQGLSDVEGDAELKREMMIKIFEANLELKAQLARQEPD